MSRTGSGSSTPSLITRTTPRFSAKNRRLGSPGGAVMTVGCVAVETGVSVIFGGGQLPRGGAVRGPLNHHSASGTLSSVPSGPPGCVDGLFSPDSPIGLGPDSPPVDADWPPLACAPSPPFAPG